MTALGIAPTALIVIFRSCPTEPYNRGYRKAKNKHTYAMLLPRDTPVTPCTRPPFPPVSTAIYRFCQILPSSLNFAEFRQGL